jgi:hypothetical protein
VLKSLCTRRCAILLFSKEKIAMTAQWFLNSYPSSRSIIENDLRLQFWKAGFKGMWFSCTKDTAPFECHAKWNDKPFTMEWEPKNFVALKMKSPEQDLLDVFEKMLKHRALAAYKNADGNVVVEWRARNVQARFQELQASGVAQLERLDK